MSDRNKLLVLATATLFLGGCANGNNPTEDTSAHVHEFASDTYSCQTRVCLSCGEHIAPTEDHDFVKGETVEPTCNDDGFTWETCSRCGEKQETDFVPALGHEYVKIGESAATCSDPGIITYSCSRCGNETHEYSPTLPHTPSGEGTIVSPTCTEGGYTIKICDECHETIFSDFLPALGHVSDKVSDSIVAPTCEEKGYTDHVCSVCHEHFQDSFVDETGHQYAVEKHVEATCAHVSYDVLRCQTCGKQTYEATANDRKEHVYGADGNCSLCGESPLTAEHFAYEKEESPVLSLPQGDNTSIVYAASDAETPLRVSVSKAETAALIDKGVKSLTFFLGNPDANRRTFGFRLQSNSAFSYQSTDDTPGFSSAPYFTVRLLNDDGTRASGVTDKGLSFELIHTNYDDGDVASKKTESFAIQVMASKLFRPEDPSSYVIDVDGFTSYTEGKGFKTSVSNPETASYRCYLPAKLFEAKINEGFTSFSLTYSKPWDGVEYKGNPTKTNFQHWAYFVDGDGNHVRGVFSQAWIMTGEEKEDGSYTFTYPLTNTKWDMAYSDFEMNWSGKDQDGIFVGATYWSISFAK